MGILSENVGIVLVGTQGSGNVGSVARLCSNFDVTSLTLVSPECDWLNAEAQKFACHLSLPLLRGAAKVETLAEAVAGAQAVVGFSRRPGDLRQQKISLDEIATVAREGKVALVFGREDNGLSREEVLGCTQVCALPSSSACPSMNLSHAVGVVLARLFSLLDDVAPSEPPASPKHRSLAPATAEEFELLMDEFQRACRSVGLDRAGNPERMMPYVRRLFQRARMSHRELGVLRLFLSHVLRSQQS